MKPIKAFAIPLADVLEMYKNGGYDIENEDAEVPNVLRVGKDEYFFTGDLIPQGEEFLEIVIVGDWFSFDDVVSEMDEDEDGDLVIPVPPGSVAN